MSKEDLVARGERGSNRIGTAVFCGLRAIDPLIQHSLLLSTPIASLARKLGRTPPRPPPSGGALITTAGLDLTPFQAVILSMSVGSALKQIYWLLVTCNEPLSPSSAVIIALFNTVNNACNSILFTVAGSNPTYLSPYTMYAGATLYTIGILVEPIAETQRKRFKDKPENKGKPYAGGLFGLARNINYGAYTLWRAGFALAAGGPVWGAVCAAFFISDFATRAIPTLEDYCRNRYGDQWKRVEKDVPYRLWPGIY